MNDWISVAEAAELLGVSARQARSLAESGGVPARRVGRSWLLDEAAVRSRASRAPSAGRPLSASMAWLILDLVQRSLDAPPRDDGGQQLLDSIPDRRVRYRLHQLLAEPVSAQRWQQWLGSRARRRRMWVHPGVIDRMAADGRLRAGGGYAAAARDVGIASAPPRRFYVHRDDVDQVIRDYRARDDVSGQVELLVFQGDAAEELVGGEGPLPVVVALADLLESDDARERHVAAEQFERFSLSGAS